MDLLTSLNKEQRKAVKHLDGPLLLLAGAGAGKTKVLTHRMAVLIQNGVSPFQILAITFTNKAAKEMRERVNALMPEAEHVWVSTFHSLCVRILRRDIDKIGFDPRFTIYDADDSERLIKQCLKELDFSDKQYPPKSVASAIGAFKNELITVAQAERENFDFRQKKMAEVYALYQRKLRANNALDFDDIIFKTVELFTAREDVAARYQERFKYVMVDEYQDTNTAQYELVRILSGKYKNLCVVGDDDQSIYGWRGANIRNILDFEKDFRKAKVIKLEQNYRSTQTILNAANAVIKNNVARKDKTLWTENGDGELIHYYKAPSDLDEANFVTDTILKQVQAGAALKDFAVLYRNNAQSRTIEDSFINRGVAYRLLGGVRFYERKEIRDLISYLKFINNPFDSLALARIINVPRRGIGDTTLDRLLQYAAEHDIGPFQALGELDNISGLGIRQKRLNEFKELIDGLREVAEHGNAYDVVSEVLTRSGYKAELEAGIEAESKTGSDESRDRLENLMELLSKAKSFIEMDAEPDSEGEIRGKDLSAFLEEIALVADVDSYNESDDAAVMMTLHSSKGLEFTNVFLVGFEEGLFPGYRATVSGDMGDMEEERRLCYVGMTRAKQKLYICSAHQRMTHGQTMYNSPSRFLKEIPMNLINNGRPPAKPIGIRTRAAEEHAKHVQAYGRNVLSAAAIPAPKDTKIDFAVGDEVLQSKYGVGKVLEIRPAGADFEVTVEFPGVGTKKFMAHLSKLKKN